MNPYTYIIFPHIRPEIVWAEDIESAVKLVQGKMLQDDFAIVSSFGGTDKVEIGKRAVN